MPFEVPNGWCWCQFGEFVDVRDGTHDSPKYVANGIPFVTSKNLKNGEIDFSTVSYISEKDHQNFIKRSKVDVGDILFAMIGSIGNPVKVNIAKEFSIKNVALFKPFVKSTNMDYVLLFLQFVQGNLQKDAKGGMQPFIPLSYFRKDLYIPLPPEKEQETIVSEVEKLLTIVDNIEQSKQDLSTAISQTKNRILDLAIHGKLVPQDPNDEPASELLKRINPKAVSSCDNPHYLDLPNGWISCNLENVIELYDNNRKPINGAERQKRKSGKITAALYPYYGATGLVDYIDSYLFDGQYVLLGEDGAPFLDVSAKKAFIVHGKFWVNNHAHVLKSLISTEYLVHVLNCFDYRDYVKGSTRLKLTQKDMLGIPIYLPPYKEQLRIVSKVNELFSQLELIKESLQA